MSRSKELAKNTIILSIGTFLPKLMSIVTIPIITGHLTKIEYGTYDLVTTLVSLLLPISTLQIQSAAFRFLIDSRDDENERKGIITNIYVFLIPVALLVLAVSFFLLNNIQIVTRLLIMTYAFADSIMLATQQVVRGLSNNKLFSICSIVKSFAYMLLIYITLQCKDLGLNGVLISFVAANIIGLILLCVKGDVIRNIDFRTISFPLIKVMLNYSWPMVPNTLSSWILSTSDRLVLTAFMGIEAVAIYGVANRIPNLINTVKGTFIFAWQENASLAINDNDVEKYYSHMFDGIYCIISGITAVLIGVTPIIFQLLIRGDYNDSYSHMPILYMAIFFSALASVLGGIYVAHKRTKSVGITTMLAAGCNLIIDFALVKSIGIYAASISTLVSYMLLAFYRMHDVKKFQEISYRTNKVAICLAVLIGMCVLCWINAPYTNIFNLIIGPVFAVYLNRKLLIGILNSLRYRILNG